MLGTGLVEPPELYPVAEPSSVVLSVRLAATIAQGHMPGMRRSESIGCVMYVCSMRDARVG